MCSMCSLTFRNDPVTENFLNTENSNFLQQYEPQTVFFLSEPMQSPDSSTSEHKTQRNEPAYYKFWSSSG